MVSLQIPGVTEGDHKESKSLDSWSLGGIKSRVFLEYVPAFLATEQTFSLGMIFV